MVVHKSSMCHLKNSLVTGHIWPLRNKKGQVTCIRAYAVLFGLYEVEALFIHTPRKYI
jgi:hypothetical protein